MATNLSRHLALETSSERVLIRRRAPTGSEILLFAHVATVLGMVAAIAWPDRVVSMMTFLVAAVLGSIAGLLYTLQVRMRDASKHRRLRGELVVEGLGRGAPGYRSAVRGAVVHADGERTEAKELRVALTHWTKTSQTRYSARGRTVYAVQLVSAERAWELEQSASLDDARYVAEKVAAALGARVVELTHTPYGSQREPLVGFPLVLGQCIAVGVAPALLAESSDRAWWTAGALFVAIHLGAHEVIRVTRAGMADRVAGELIKATLEAEPADEAPATPKKKKRKKPKPKAATSPAPDQK